MPATFTAEHFDLLQRMGDEKYDPSNQAHAAAYATLANAYNATSHWATQLHAALQFGGKVVVRRAPVNQGKKFRTYNWAKLYPHDSSPWLLAYTVGLNANEGFVVKIDTVNLDDRHPVRAAYLALRDSTSPPPFVAVLPIEQGLAMTLDDLTAWSAKAVRSFTMQYEEVAKRTGADVAAEPETVLRHFDIAANFRAMRRHWSASDTALFCRLAQAVHEAGMDWWFSSGATYLRFGRKNAGSGRAVSAIGAVRGSRACLVSWRRKLESIGRFLGPPIPADMVDDIESTLALKDPALLRLIPTDEAREGLWPAQAGDEATLPEASPSVPGTVDGVDDALESAASAELAFNRIYFGPPGTGKTHGLGSLLQEEFTADPSEPSAMTGELKRYAFVTFHQSYGYEDFVEGLRPVIGGQGDAPVHYEVRAGVFKKLCERARAFPAEKFAIVIDEINRGNISKIFGELITLLELDKRTGAKGCHSVTLPYSQEEFSVPRNVSVVGTMNTADRSLALLDTALRRRFEFEEVLPDSQDSARAPLAGLRVTVDGQIVNVPKLLTAINLRIETLYDRDHLIGHSYFVPLKNYKDGTERMQALNDIFAKQILPLLEEYFFDDWHKIRLVLADNQKPESHQFIQETVNHERALTRLFGERDAAELRGMRSSYTRNDQALLDPQAYVAVYASLLGVA